jgi:hypothetical protein
MLALTIALMSLHPWFVSLRQSLAMEPVRYRFETTRIRTAYAWDESQQLWRILPVDETGGAELRLGAIMGEPLPSGKYHVVMRFLDEGGLLDLTQFRTDGTEAFRRQLAVGRSFDMDFDVDGGALHLALSPLWNRPVLQELTMERIADQ